jgi:hypothetical protein
MALRTTVTIGVDGFRPAESAYNVSFRADTMLECLSAIEALCEVIRTIERERDERF